MKRRVSIVKPAILIVCVLAAWACTQPPTAEMQKATEAVTKAQQDPLVPVYAPESLQRATDLLAQMNEAAAAKKYDTARKLALDAQAAAEQAISDAKTRQEQAKNEANQAIEALKKAFPEAETALAAARKARNPRINIEKLSQDLQKARDSLKTAESSYASGQYKAAYEAAIAGRNTLSKIVETISSAAQVSSKKK
ncbi:DUF4398 domain-containing protein [Treponema sp. J25]|uniref:DUF4398 domain-containing protein n=1 Tax=Treponema sp. J25 TaxID=2094121 RepID=UPI00104EF794|nr:DUF4398 domain-containing protein [Treponema sp. J25]TCW61162.1 hypothetical protein C5O22_07885 [Treponema sp. J25]